MALLGYDGFEGIVQGDLSLRYTVTATPLVEAGGVEGRRLNCSASANIEGITVSVPSTTEMIVGFNFQLTASPAQNYAFFEFREGATVHVCVGGSATDTLRVTAGTQSGTLLAENTGYAWPIGAWVFVEIRVLISNTVGEVEIFVDGTSVLSATGLDTNNGGASGVINALGPIVRRTNAAPDFLFDDWYWLDTSGVAPDNDFLGPIRVDRLVPTSDGGTTDFTPSTGSDNFAMIDESLPDGDTTYNEATTIGSKDIVGMGDLPTASGTIFAVQTRVRARRTDAGAVQLTPSIISSGNEEDGAAVGLSASYTELRDLFTSDPNGGGAWADSAVNALQVAYRISA